MVVLIPEIPFYPVAIWTKPFKFFSAILWRFKTRYKKPGVTLLLCLDLTGCPRIILGSIDRSCDK
jgi:hypothetical protein